MRSSRLAWWVTGFRLWAAVALVSAGTALALAQQAGGDRAAQRSHARMEYVHQDVQADAVVQTLNDLDGQGWTIFQIIPSWQLKNDNGQNDLLPKAYEVFGRRPAR